jgi:hypothetical protein
MRVKVERCFNGNRDVYTYRMTLPDGRRESIRGEQWSRSLASEAKDRLSSLYHVNRDAIRFDHVN